MTRISCSTVGAGAAPSQPRHGLPCRAMVATRACVLAARRRPPRPPARRAPVPRLRAHPAAARWPTSSQRRAGRRRRRLPAARQGRRRRRARSRPPRVARRAVRARRRAVHPQRPPRPRRARRAPTACTSARTTCRVAARARLVGDRRADRPLHARAAAGRRGARRRRRLHRRRPGARDADQARAARRSGSSSCATPRPTRAVPWFAIGGIDARDVGEVLAAGARADRVVRAIADAADPGR